MYIAIIFIACLIISVLGFLLYKEHKKQQNIIEINHKNEEYNEQLKQSISQLSKQYKNIQQEFQNKTESLAKLTSSVNATAKEYETIAKERAENEYKNKIASLEQEYQRQITELGKKLDQKILDYKVIEDKTKDMEAKQLAYIQMKQREEEIAKQKDFYRLVLTEQDNQDIQFLRQAQNQIFHKEAIDKIIWDIYVKPAYDILMAHLSLGTQNKTCGVYKITCLVNEKAYIGQSVDIRERWKQHIKSALSSNSTQNKLYQEMKNQGIDNFTFEILEEIPREKLNDREVYWIDFCKTKEWGLNGTKGGS